MAAAAVLSLGAAACISPAEAERRAALPAYPTSYEECREAGGERVSRAAGRFCLFSFRKDEAPELYSRCMQEAGQPTYARSSGRTGNLAGFMQSCTLTFEQGEE